MVTCALVKVSAMTSPLTIAFFEDIAKTSYRVTVAVERPAEITFGIVVITHISADLIHIVFLSAILITCILDN
jgi:hypothetical protein